MELERDIKPSPTNLFFHIFLALPNHEKLPSIDFYNALNNSPHFGFWNLPNLPTKKLI